MRSLTLILVLVFGMSAVAFGHHRHEDKYTPEDLAILRQAMTEEEDEAQYDKGEEYYQTTMPTCKEQTQEEKDKYADEVKKKFPIEQDRHPANPEYRKFIRPYLCMDKAVKEYRLRYWNEHKAVRNAKGTPREKWLKAHFKQRDQDESIYDREVADKNAAKRMQQLLKNEEQDAQRGKP